MVTVDTERPLFGRVFDILCYNSTVLIDVQIYVGEYFISHYNAFLICCNGEFSALNICTLQDHRPVVVSAPAPYVRARAMPHVTILNSHFWAEQSSGLNDLF